MESSRLLKGLEINFNRPGIHNSGVIFISYTGLFFQLSRLEQPKAAPMFSFEGKSEFRYTSIFQTTSNF